MATAPQINLRDGSGTSQQVVFTTNRETITLDGTVDSNTVDLQVSVNGANFVSDPTLVDLDGTTFRIPNPASFPDGLTLELGLNTILIRAIDVVGGVSSPSSANITRVVRVDDEQVFIPSGVRVRRKRNVVDVLAAKPVAIVARGLGDSAQDAEFRGFNYYASTAPGGTTGYFRVNDKPVTTVSTIIEEDAATVSTSRTEFSPEADSVRVRVALEDAFGKEIGLVSDNRTFVASYATDLRFSSTIEEVTRTNFIFFRHNRAGGTNHLNSDQFVDVLDSDPLYYVVSAVYFDPIQGVEFETPYSQEVLGAPLIIDTAIRDLPGRTQLQIVLDYVSAIQRVNAEIALIPGSTTRDVSIDPFANEAERLWFIVDFVHRSQSFLTLLQIDDANGDGVSDPVATSAYKQALKAALGFQTDAAVQTLIDSQFDKLAGNFKKPRLPGRPSVGQVIFFSALRPTTDVLIPSGTIVTAPADSEAGLPTVRYVVGGTFLLPASDAEAFYNFERRRYEITADVVAETIGSSGNRSPGDVKNVATPVGGFEVTNTEALVFGTDRETNSELATRAELGFISVDTGTEGGYAATAAEQIGIVKSKIVKSGDALMMRDYDEVRRKHIGGKVDIWVQGLRERTVTEQFAFTFAVARDVRIQIIDLANLIFRVLDSRVTVNTPITDILDNASQGLGVRNVTIGQDYDLTGVTILDYQTFQLNTAVTQPTTNIDDIITVDYRFQSVNQFRFTFQPVRRVVSVVGEASGALSSTQGYALYRTDDPLLTGESTLANDYLIISQVGGIPTGATITVNDEQHVIIGFNEERLASIGVNTATVRVFNRDRTVEYDGPGSLSPDFEIIEGAATTPARIVRTSSSDIVSGETVSVDYEHDENFTVTYVINDLLQQLQRTVDRRRHITADAIVKQAIRNEVDLDTTIQLKNGAAKDKVDPATRANVSRELNQKLIGQGTAQSDMINAIDSTDGVDYQVLPLARMAYADGSRKLRERVVSSSQRVPSLDIGGNRVFILSNSLQFPTTDGGGLTTEHRGVFQDDEPMVLSATLSGVGQFQNQAFIIGNEGAIITGLTDDATLIGEGYDDTEEILEERLRRTANHVILSLSGAGVPPDDPANHVYAVSYVIRGDVGPHDIPAAEVEFIELGDLTLTFRSA